MRFSKTFLQDGDFEGVPLRGRVFLVLWTDIASKIHRKLEIRFPEEKACKTSKHSTFDDTSLLSIIGWALSKIDCFPTNDICDVHRGVAVNHPQKILKKWNFDLLTHIFYNVLPYATQYVC